MIHHRSAQEVKWFDIIKLIVLIILIILLLLNWFWSSGAGPAASSQPPGSTPAAAQASPTPTTPPPTQTPKPTATPTPTRPAVVAPTLNLPTGPLTPGEITLTGTGAPGSQVAVIVDGQPAGTVKVGADGTWSLPLELTQAKDYAVSAQALDASGKAAAESDKITLTVTAPPTPTPKPPTPTPTAVPVTPPTLNAPGGEVTAGKVTLTGTGEPGSQVEIVVDGQVVGQTTVGADGRWSFEADLPQAGDYEISVQSVDAEGNVLAASQPVMLTVVKAITPPTLDKPRGDLTAGKVELTGAGEPGSQVVILIDGKEAGQVTVGADGKWSFATDLPKAGDYEVKVQMVDGKGQVVAESEASRLSVAKAPVIAPTLDKPGDALIPGPVRLTGTGAPNSEVVIVIDGQEAGRAKVDARGRWSFTTDFSQPGNYEIKVQTVDEAGQTLAESRATTLTITTPCREIYIVQKDDWLSKLAQKYYNEMFDYPLIVEATNAKAKEDSKFLTIPNPDLIEIGQQLCIPEKP